MKPRTTVPFVALGMKVSMMVPVWPAVRVIGARVGRHEPERRGGHRRVERVGIRDRGEVDRADSGSIASFTSSPSPGVGAPHAEMRRCW
jgi:hypothetical protein